MGRLTAVGGRVGSLPARIHQPPKIADPFYQSSEWRRLVAAIKRERGAFCERCGSKDRIIADHIIERKDGGADLDRTNIELLCHRHHAEKTANARRARASRAA